MNLTLTFNSIEDDTALRAKVDEALNVYDEYVKNKGGEGEGEGGEAAKETKDDDKTEEKA
jgi:polyadenylate-binding protein